MFTIKTIQIQNAFDKLYDSNLEDIAKGRKGGILVDETHSIVRTTTDYKNKPMFYTDVHYSIMQQIGHQFNNAMIEVYDNQYRTMGYHSDQALDLANDSYIAIFSCYDNVDNYDVRTLKIKDKMIGTTCDIEMTNNSVIIFSTETNKLYHHKIILEEMKTDCKWLGITFRLSKTFRTDLVMATDDQKKEFYRMRKEENGSIDYVWPDIGYTLSHGDFIS